MALAAYFQPRWELNRVGKKLVNLSTDTFQMGLIASGVLAARGTTQNYETVADLLANGGSALVEVSTSGTGYTRQALTGVTWTQAALADTFTANNPVWNPATLTTIYGWIHDETASAGTDATRPLVAILDFGGSFSPAGQSLTGQINASGIYTGTAAVLCRDLSRRQPMREPVMLSRLRLVRGLARAAAWLHTWGNLPLPPTRR